MSSLPVNWSTIGGGASGFALLAGAGRAGMSAFFFSYARLNVNQRAYLNKLLCC
jgi:hypothetical protein